MKCTAKSCKADGIDCQWTYTCEEDKHWSGYSKPLDIVVLEDAVKLTDQLSADPMLIGWLGGIFMGFIIWGL